MTALIIIGAIILFLAVLLLLPLTIDLSYNDNKFLLKVKYSGITVYNNAKIKNSKKSKRDDTSPKEQNGEKDKKNKDNFLKTTYKQKGLVGTITYFGNILVLILKKLFWMIKHLKFKKFHLDLSVSGDDAADTAISYGKICTAVYPVLSLLQTSIDFKPEQINVSADFDDNKSRFAISFIMTTSFLNYIILAISALTQFVKLQNKESEKYERKQS